MKHWQLYLGLLVVFVAGIVIGSVGSLLVVRHKVDTALNAGPAEWRELAIARMKRELKLRPEQVEQLRPVFRDAHQELLALRAQQQPELERVLADAIDDMVPYLDADQVANLRTRFANYRERFKVPLDIQAPIGADPAEPLSAAPSTTASVPPREPRHGGIIPPAKDK